MNKNALLIGAAVVVFIAVGGFLVSRGSGHGGGQNVTIDLNVTGVKVDRPDISAHQGDRVTMTFTADRAEEIHLHGYDKMFKIERPGDRVTMTFDADKTGDFPFEIEDTSTELGRLKVT